MAESITVSSQTAKKIDSIVETQFDGDESKQEEALNRALDVYEPFTQDAPNDVLKRIGEILVHLEEIDSATESEVTNYALKGLMAHFAESLKQAEKLEA